MSPLTRAVTESGGVTRRRVLVERFGRLVVDHALAEGELTAVGRDRYVLPETAEAPRLAHRVTGLLCLSSAALHHGWEVAIAPDRPHVVVPRGRRVDPDAAARLQLHRGLVEPDDRAGLATGLDLTLDQCGRRLPFVEALAIFDSALRHGVPPSTLTRVAQSSRGPGAPQLRRVARAADPRAANPFESVLRGIGEDVPGLRLVPQVLIRSERQTVRPDLVDEALGLVVEADSFEWHGDRAALRADARRYDLLVADGWVVLRFAWEDVMHDQGFVRSVLEAVTARLRSGWS